jgi:hypothetical protein
MPEPTVVHKGVYALLQTVPGIGAPYLGRAPQNAALPFTIYQRISGERWGTLTGPSGLAQSRFQIDSYAATPEAAIAAAELIRQRIDGYSGTIGGVRLDSVSKDNDLPDREDIDGATSTGQIPFCASKDYIITHEEQ